MLRKILIATSLIFVSGSALALDEFLARPRVSITFGGGHYDYGHQDYYREVYVPRSVHVQPIYYNDYYRAENRRHHGWNQRDLHHDEWRGYRQPRHSYREHHDDD